MTLKYLHFREGLKGKVLKVSNHGLYSKKMRAGRIAPPPPHPPKKRFLDLVQFVFDFIRRPFGARSKVTSQRFFEEFTFCKRSVPGQRWRRRGRCSSPGRERGIRSFWQRWRRRRWRSAGPVTKLPSGQFITCCLLYHVPITCLSGLLVQHQIKWKTKTKTKHGRESK